MNDLSSLNTISNEALEGICIEKKEWNHFEEKSYTKPVYLKYPDTVLIVFFSLDVLDWYNTLIHDTLLFHLLQRGNHRLEDQLDSSNW